VAETVCDPLAENDVVVDGLLPPESVTGLPMFDPSATKVTVPVGVELPDDATPLAVSVTV